MEPWKQPTPKARMPKCQMVCSVSAYRQTQKYPTMQIRISGTVACFLDRLAKTRDPIQATTWVASRKTTWPTVSSPRSVPMLMQLSMIVPTPSMYRKKASRKNSTFLSCRAMVFSVRPIFLSTSPMACFRVST